MLHAGVRVPVAAGFAATTGGMLLLSGAEADGSYLGDLLPGMLIAGLGLGLVLVSVSVSVMTGAKDEETGMLSGLNTTGHEIGGAVGVPHGGAVAPRPAGVEVPSPGAPRPRGPPLSPAPPPAPPPPP